MKNILVFLMLILTSGIYAQGSNEEIDRFFAGHSCAFVLYDSLNGTFLRHDDLRCEEEFLPASTFKIPNSIIGLETGVIPDENFVIKWDGKERGIKEWNRNHSLASAIKYSVVPYYQELARMVGIKKMQNYLTKFNYGNKIIGERIDTFWLDNSLKISANEEVEFLRKFYSYKLPVSSRSIDIVKKIISKEKYPGSQLNFKTGGGRQENGKWIGWLVGYLEKGTNVYFFALNVDGDSFQEVSELRNEIPRKVMKFLKIIE